mmetsp:Transcript_15286/g.32194  ORF Transcript_15286/g.32194 Transcript_15286/m.32194 type:complete len:221 (-) Transcript_15286:395-1057(-)
MIARGPILFSANFRLMMLHSSFFSASAMRAAPSSPMLLSVRSRLVMLQLFFSKTSARRIAPASLRRLWLRFSVVTLQVFLAKDSARYSTPSSPIRLRPKSKRVTKLCSRLIDSAIHLAPWSPTALPLSFISSTLVHVFVDNTRTVSEFSLMKTLAYMPGASVGPRVSISRSFPVSGSVLYNPTAPFLIPMPITSLSGSNLLSSKAQPVALKSPRGNNCTP